MASQEDSTAWYVTTSDHNMLTCVIKKYFVYTKNAKSCLELGRVPIGVSYGLGMLYGWYCHTLLENTRNMEYV